jgi:phage terminase large subunit-like protein
MAKTVTHDGDARLAAHIASCVAKSTHGDLITKDRRNSPRKIDTAVGAILAFDRTAAAAKPVKKRTGFAYGF